MPNTPPRFFRRRDGRLHPAGWALLLVGAALFIIVALFKFSSGPSGHTKMRDAERLFAASGNSQGAATLAS